MLKNVLGTHSTDYAKSLFRFIVLQTAIGTITTLHPNIKK